MGSAPWWALRYYGHDDAKVLNGGLTKWTAEGRPLEATPPLIRLPHSKPGFGLSSLLAAAKCSRL